MKTRRLLFVVGLLMGLAPAAGAQWIDFATPGIPRLPDGKPNLAAPAPKTPDGKPDLSGIWRAAGRGGEYGYDFDITRDLQPGAVLPWAESVRLKRIQDFRKDSPLAACRPVSVPFLNLRGLSRIVQTPGVIVILYEQPNSPHRTIYTDGRPLPRDMNPTWLGYSVGRWEQDTLVVTTAGFNDKGWLDVGGHPQTETLRLTERFRRRDFGHLELEMTVEDPKAFAKPFTLRMEKPLEADTQLLEDVCENERSSTHLSSGVTLGAEVLAKYAGRYKFGSGRQAEVKVAGDQLVIEDSASPVDRVFVAGSEATFSSSLSQVSIEFVRDSQGKATQMIRRAGAVEERAARVP
jgi:hypothetical protein